MFDVILTENGKPIERPDRENYPDRIEWLRACCAYNDRVRQIAYDAFTNTLIKTLHEEKALGLRQSKVK